MPLTGLCLDFCGETLATRKSYGTQARVQILRDPYREMPNPGMQPRRVVGW